MKKIFAQWPELERRGMRNLVTVVLGICLVCVLLALVLLLSGCADVDETPSAVTHTHETTWLLSTQKAHLTKVTEPVRMQDGTILETTNFSLYVYECSATYARISSGTIAQTWIPRVVLANDECETGTTANDNEPLLDLRP